MKNDLDLILSPGPAETSAVRDAVTNRSRSAIPMMAMMLGIDPGFGPTYRIDPCIATVHGTAAALKAEAPQVRGQRQFEGVCPGEPFCSCWASAIALPRDTKRAARKVRMAAKRRRGW